MRNYFFVRWENKNVKIKFDDILYIESCKNFARIVTQGKVYLVLYSMAQLEERLPAHLFCRIHRSFIVPVNQITSFDMLHVYLGDKSFPIAESNRHKLFKKISVLGKSVQKGK